MIKSILQIIYTVYVLTTFVVCLLMAFPVFVLFGVWDRVWARRIIWDIVHYWAIGWLVLIGQPMIRKGQKPRDDKYVYIANHISYMDTILIYAAIPYYFRTLAKIEMSRIPVFGFVYKQLAILVDRSSAHSRSRSLRLMWRMLKRECNIAIFPEGTFNETDAPMKEFYDGAFRLAINTQTPIQPMLFPDTVNRWHYSKWWRLSPGRNRVIYLDPVPVVGLQLKDMAELKAKVHRLMSEAMQTTKTRL